MSMSVWVGRFGVGLVSYRDPKGLLRDLVELDELDEDVRRFRIFRCGSGWVSATAEIKGVGFLVWCNWTW